jgi:Tfp pilus assembly protein PilE
MATSTIVAIVIAVVAALLLIAVLAWAVRRRGEYRRRVQAERIRERVDQESVHVQRREAFAEETAAKAHAAQTEAAPGVTARAAAEAEAG